MLGTAWPYDWGHLDYTTALFLFIMPLKRDNWTNAEVIKLIEDQQIFKTDGSEDGHCKAHNQVVLSVASFFRSHFAVPDDNFSALALDTETGEVFHVGKILPR